MNQPPDPFARMNLGSEEKLPEPMTAEKAVLGTIGLALMGVGGLAAAVGFILLETFAQADQWLLAGGLALLVVLLGVGMCFAGYWVFGRGQRRRRHLSTGALPDHLMRYQDKFQLPGELRSAAEDEGAIRRNGKHGTE